MKDRYQKLMVQQHTSANGDAAFLEKLKTVQPKKQTAPLLRAAIAAACICLLIPVTAWAAKNIFGVTKITIGAGKDFYGKDAVVMHRDIENVEHILITEFSHDLQELKETQWLYFDSWEDAEEKMGIDFIGNSLLNDKNTQPYSRKKTYGHDERIIKSKSTPYWGTYYVADEQLFAIAFNAEYYRSRVRFMISAYATTDHPLMTEEIFQVYHGFGDRYYKETDHITIEQFVTKNGIPATIFYDGPNSLGWIHPHAYFSVNNISYHIEFTQFGRQGDETDEQTNERLLALLREILDGFVVE